MNCYLSGVAGLALLGGSFATLTVTEEQHSALRKVLSDDLAQKYEVIVTERRNHYIFGLILGFMLSFVITNNIRGLNYFTRLMLFFTITLTTGLVFYMLMPKSDFMLNHLKTPEQNKKWLEVYQTMKMRYLLGFLLGALAAIPVAGIFC